MEFRLPPFFDEGDYRAWEPTPANWLIGTWYFQYSNSPIYHKFQDIQWTLSPTDSNPVDGTLHDLTTEYALNLTSHIYQEYGVDIPTVLDELPVPDSYTYMPTQVPSSGFTFENGTWAVIAWGYDSNGVPYAVVYEGAANGVGPVVDIISRDDDGPSKATVDLVLAGIKDLNNTVLGTALTSLMLVSQDGGRNEEMYPSCNATCMTNSRYPKFGLFELSFVHSSWYTAVDVCY